MAVFVDNIYFLFSKFNSKIVVFRHSILFYPVIFTLVAVILFIVTSSIDRSIASAKLSVDIPYVESLVFAGSASAARSILSTIASGWATILGVAYSVTLITLQLSTSRYTSHLINRFEQDKVNQVTLGWFIFVVAYSLLVLKTVRTEDIQNDILPLLTNSTSMVSASSIPAEGFSTSFAPLVGVNMAVIMSIAGLFIFVLFLRNIISYMRPNMLISDIVSQIISTLKSYEHRKFRNEKLDPENANKIIKLRSESTGIIININWERINDTISQDVFAEGLKRARERNKLEEDVINEQNNNQYLLEWSKSIGDRVNKNDLLATLYTYRKNKKQNPSASPQAFDSNQQEYRKQKANDIQSYTQDGNNSNHSFGSMSKSDSSSLKNVKSTRKLLSAIQITKDKSSMSDPLYGIDLIQSIAVKASKSLDIDIVNSCVSGLFEILRYVMENKDPMGKPFMVKEVNRKTHIFDIEKDVPKPESKTDKTQNKNINKNFFQRPKEDSFSLIIIPKENSLVSIILSELSVIVSSSTSNDKVHVYNNIIIEYTRISTYLVDLNKIDEFVMLTKWLSVQIGSTAKIFNEDLINSYVIDPLVSFRKELIAHQNSPAYTSFVALIDPILENFNLVYDNRT